MMETKGMTTTQAQVSQDPEFDEAPREVKLVVHRIHPWSVMKMSFLLSVVFGIAMVLAMILLWFALDAMQVFSAIQQFVGNVDSNSSVSPILDFMQLPRFIALSIVVAVLNTVLITVLATVGAMIYNLIAALVGGVKMTLIDE